MTLLASLPSPVFVLDQTCLITDLNPAAEGLLNKSRRAVLGLHIDALLGMDAAVLAALGRVAGHGAPLFVADLMIDMQHRGPLRCDLQAAAHDQGVVMVITQRDFAAQITAAEEAQSAVKSAIGMADMLAHEIKNPLAGITGAAQLLSMGLAGEDLALTDLIVEESQRIVKLLEQVEQFGNLTLPDLGPVNIHDVLDRARRSALVGFGAHMEITEAYDPSLPMAQSDADQLLQVVLNLLKNAAEAAEGKGKITIRTFYEHSLRRRQHDGGGRALPLHIEIIDDGPGLPEAIRKDVFDPFVSGRENGTGLGLALVSKIIHDHGGWIAYESVPGRTVFRLSLAKAPHAPKERRAEKRAEKGAEKQEVS